MRSPGTKRPDEWIEPEPESQAIHADCAESSRKTRSCERLGAGLTTPPMARPQVSIVSTMGFFGGDDAD